MIFKFSVIVLLYAVLLYFVLLFVVLILYSFIFSTKQKNNKRNTIDQVYYDNVNNNEYSNVNTNLIRYIPKYNNEKIKNGKSFLEKIFFQLMLIVLGGIASIIGVIGTYQAVKIKLSYPSVISTIVDTYTYEIVQMIVSHN